MKGRRLAGLLLALCLLAGGTAVHAQAAERAEEDYLYYSDIFWGYPKALTGATFVTYHNYANQSIIPVLGEYVETSAFQASVIELGLKFGTDWGAFAKYLADNAFKTNFQLNDSMDAANKLLAEAFLDVTYLDAANGVGAPIPFLKATKTVANSVEKISKAVQELEGMTLAEQRETLSDLLDEMCLNTGVDQGAISNALAQNKNVFLDLMGTLGTTAGALEKISSFLQALAVSAAMSDAQLEMIRAVIDTQPSGSLLYRGMTRLYDQLSDGYLSYFTSTFLSEQAYGKVTGLLRNCVQDGSLILGSATYRALTAVIDLTRTAIFDWIWDVDYNDYATAVVLYQYCDDFFEGVQSKAGIFTSQFALSDVEEYESLYLAYLATNRAALEHYKKLAVHNAEYNAEWLDGRIAALCGEDVSADYAAYIDGIRAEFAAATDEGRESMRARYDYTVPRREGLTVSTQGSDQIEEGVIYFVDGVWDGSIILDNNTALTVPARTEAAIAGMLDAVGYACEVTVSGELEVDGGFRVVSNSALNVHEAGASLRAVGDSSSAGEITISQQADMVIHGDFSASSSSVDNQGTLEVTGSVTAYSMETLFPDDAAEGTLYVGGDLTFSNTPTGGYKPSGGTVVFNGTEQQAVKRLTAYRVEVTNPAGLRYESDQYLYGPFDLHGNPLETQGHRTWVHENSVLAPGEENDYGAVCVDGNNSTLLADGGVYRCELRMCGDDCRLTIPAGTSAVITGDLWVGYSGSSDTDAEVYLCGELEVLGDVTVGGGYPNGLITMDGADAALSVHGNLAVRDYFSGISGGTVIFSGTEQQAVSDLEADNVEIRNPAGLRYESNLTIRGHYDPNGNPIETQGYKTLLDKGATLEPGTENDYQTVFVQKGKVTLAADGVYHGDFTVQAGGSLIIPSGVKAVIAGSLIVHNRPALSNSGDLEVTGDVTVEKYGQISNVGDAVLTVHGDLTIEGYDSELTSGTVIFSGTEQQAVSGLEANNVEIRNPAGIRYEGDLTVCGHYNLNGNPIEIQGYETILVKGATLEPGMENDYQTVFVQEGKVTLAADGVYRGDFTVQAGGSLIIPSGVKAVIAGNFIVYNSTALSNSGDLEVTGDVTAGRYGRISNIGDAVLRLGGNLTDAGLWPIEGGTLILNGTGPQVMPYLEMPVLILENESPEGVTFASRIWVTTLFDHRGNAFTLYNNGDGSHFPDYDGDGLLDHVDPEPTVPRVAGAVLNGSTVEITFYNAGLCDRVAVALYSADGRLLDLRLRDVAGDTLREDFSAAPEDGFIKVFYLTRTWRPCAAAERLP